MRRFCSLLLIVLLILFYNEILALGLRMYVAFTDSPRASVLLAQYYNNASLQNAQKAERFYRESFEQFKSHAQTGTEQDKFRAAINLAHMYECGQGTSQDMNQAKSWYQQSLKTATDDQKKAIEQKLATLNASATKPQDENAKVDAADEQPTSSVTNGDSIINMNCQGPTEPHFASHLWKYLKSLRK